MLLNSTEACALLGCHYTTLLYRERVGQIKSRKAAGKKLWHKADVLLLAKSNPVNPKPHYTKRIIKQSLWTQLKKFLKTVFAAK